MEAQYDPVLQICKLCKSSFLQRHFADHFNSCHDEGNLFLCESDGCSMRYKTILALRRHKTISHNGPEAKSVLEDGQRMIWAEEVKMVHNNKPVGIYVGVTNYYHPHVAAADRDRDGKKCIVSKHFLSEGLCYCDHDTARELLTVAVLPRDNENKVAFEKRTLEVTTAYKMYTRQHFVKCICSNFTSTYELSEKKEKTIRRALRDSEFSKYYTDDIQQPFTYHVWKNSKDGQEAVAAKRVKEGKPHLIPLQKRLASSVTSAGEPQHKMKRDTEEVEGEENLIKLINAYGRSAVRDMCDKLSQEEKKSIDEKRIALGDLKIDTVHANKM
ncbi:uncharacterized protein LOC110845496 isoform X2 [Folsomia candida]|uniref:PR domain zinc finger protein 5 n=2 Tax=Folsomia candida TaxID=158441 RepID=A0A226EM33_FOLCA|nr:uncharacterized protein LOC110845496 isoform X2 [Folsomia candida]OXA58519.1 PR domain zinc finger protein 5 [Folsomia candida]